MLTKLVMQIVDTSHRHALVIALLSFVLSVLLGWYALTHFKINTDINQLIASDLDWRQREKTLEKAFPQKVDTLLVVVDGKTAFATENATSQLTEKLEALPNLFTSVIRPDSLPFFRKNGLLFMSKAEISETLDQIIQAQPMIAALTSDPSLRGFFGTFQLMAQGFEHGMLNKDRFEKPLAPILEGVNAALNGQDKTVSWDDLMSDHQATPRDLRKFIITKPILNYNELAPGADASKAIRSLVKNINSTSQEDVRVRLTGPVPLNDEEFASVADGASTATLLSGALVIIILLAALRSLRIIIPILLTLIVGLFATTAFALWAVGSLNLISVAFAVMFIGIAVDFGIQFGVRYRDQHHLEPDHTKAMQRTAQIIAIPLATAAGSTSLGFMAFIPTAYRGVSELGLIAAAGMLIAFALNITLLPALLSLFHPPSEPEAVGFSWAKPLDLFIVKRRRPILLFTALLTILGVLISTHVQFDFDPLNLKNQKTESVSTLLDLIQDPDSDAYTVDVLKPSLADAQNLANQLDKLPEVDHVMTLASLLPDDQDAKLSLIADANALLGPSLNLPKSPAPSDDEIYESLKKTSMIFHALTGSPEATHLALALDDVISRHDHKLLERLSKNLLAPLPSYLNMIKSLLSPTRIDIDSITLDLRRDWMTSNGQYLVQVYPKGDPRNQTVLKTFTRAVQNLAPDASGPPISIQESGKTVTQAFIHAGLYALLAIAILTFVILRKASEVIRLLFPLILAGILTLATIAVIGLPLNFANIIALPLLLSLGVSYSIYFVSYWRSGMNAPLQSSMARAVLYSAATTLVAFGTLSISSHPGTASMGKLLTVSLLYCIACTFFILPTLLGSPKDFKR